VRLRSAFAAVLLALLLAVSWSAAACEMSCVLPHDSHGCCATHLKGATASLVQLQSCTHVVRPIAAPPIPPVVLALGAVKIIPVADISMAASTASRTALETASPPQFNLRI